MKKFFKYKYMRYNTRKLLVVLILFHIIVIASVPCILLLNKFFPQKKDKSATFTLSYDTPDIDFGTIDYSGIENKFELQFYRKYFLDGEPYYTDSSGIIQHYFEYDGEEHILTLLWHGVIYEYLFNTSIEQDIVLATKSIDATAYWDEIFETIFHETRTLTDLDLLYFDGTSWVVIETFTISDGIVQFINLTMGLYALSEAGDWYTSINFTIDQTTITYENDIFIVPDKTIIDIDYLDTIHGADYPVDLSNIIYTLQILSGGTTWVDLLNFDIAYVTIVTNGTLGLITIYELWEDGIYSVAIGNSWNEIHNFSVNGLIEIDLVAKSLDATVVWGELGTPVIDMMIPLYFFDGTEYVFVANYLTDSEGKINITELLPIGMYKLGENVFTITPDDIVVVIDMIAESIFWRREPHLDSNRDIEFKYFFFFMLTIKIKR